MPRGDGTGPAGMGPMTGRAAGYCTGSNAPGFANPIPRRTFWNYGSNMVPSQRPAYRRWMPFGAQQPYFFGAPVWRCGRGLGRGRGRGRRWFGW